MSSSPVKDDSTEHNVPLAKPGNPNVTTLKAAFPDVDPAVISAVLIASSNNLEKAFDGLLGMSDPNFKPDPPEPVIPIDPGTEEQQRQILADEMFARQLVAQSSARRRTERSQPRQPEQQERSFLDDELPVLKENLIQGFNETKSKVGSFISSLREQYNQRMEVTTAQESERTHQPDVYHQHPRSSTQYDRDARTLDDDFGELELQDNSQDQSGISIPRKKQEEVHDAAHSAGIGPSRATPNTSRWQPIAKSPAQEIKSEKGRDSFALGDDDDE